MTSGEAGIMRGVATKTNALMLRRSRQELRLLKRMYDVEVILPISLSTARFGLPCAKLYGSDDLHPTGEWLVDADERGVDRIYRDPGGHFVVEDPVHSRSAPAHRGPERTGRL
jgi:hypothetical protein